MQIEAIRPTGGGLSLFSLASKHLVRANPLITTNFKRSGIDELDSAAIAQAGFPEECTQWNESRRDEFHKTVVTDQSGKL
jgi:hypothetical protein